MGRLSFGFQWQTDKESRGTQSDNYSLKKKKNSPPLLINENPVPTTHSFTKKKHLIREVSDDPLISRNF